VEHASDLNRRERTSTASTCSAYTCAESVLPGQCWQSKGQGGRWVRWRSGGHSDDPLRGSSVSPRSAGRWRQPAGSGWPFGRRRRHSVVVAQPPSGRPGRKSRSAVHRGLQSRRARRVRRSPSCPNAGPLVDGGQGAKDPSRRVGGRPRRADELPTPDVAVPNRGRLLFAEETDDRGWPGGRSRSRVLG
jgi:hypothetical protein